MMLRHTPLYFISLLVNLTWYIFSNIKCVNAKCGKRADEQCSPAENAHAMMSTVILLSQVRAGPADDAVKMNTSSDIEVLYPCSLLIQFTQRRQEYVAVVKKRP
jgi:hypothetical protein